MQIEIKPFNSTHKLCVVVSRGRQYSCLWATEYNKYGQILSPTADQVKEAYREDRSSFDPYNVVRGY